MKYLIGIKRVFIAVASLVALFFLLWVFGSSLGWEEQAMHDFFVSVFSVFVGAFTAFRFNFYLDSYRNREREIKSIRKVLFKIGVMRNTVNLVRKSIQDYMNSDVAMAFMMPPINIYHSPAMDIDPGELDFLIESKDPDVLLSLSTNQYNFAQMLKTIELRSAHYSEVMRPAALKSGLHEQQATKADILDGLGDLIYNESINYAQTLKAFVLECEEKLLLSQERLIDIAKLKYREGHFPNYMPLELRDEILKSRKRSWWGNLWAKCR